MGKHNSPKEHMKYGPCRLHHWVYKHWSQWEEDTSQEKWCEFGKELLLLVLFFPREKYLGHKLTMLLGWKTLAESESFVHSKNWSSGLMVWGGQLLWRAGDSLWKAGILNVSGDCWGASSASNSVLQETAFCLIGLGHIILNIWTQLIPTHEWLPLPHVKIGSEDHIPLHCFVIFSSRLEKGIPSI